MVVLLSRRRYGVCFLRVIALSCDRVSHRDERSEVEKLQNRSGTDLTFVFEGVTAVSLDGSLLFVSRTTKNCRRSLGAEVL